MKRTTINKVISGCLGSALLLSFSACSDDHFDIKTSTPSASKTIWENIQATPQLDSLAMILENVKVYTKELDKSRTMTYAQLLNSPQSFTFWAPLNGTYNAKHYLDQIEQVKALVAEGKTEEANKLEYTLGVQFAQNHMARFNYESTKGEQEVRLYNGKLATYCAADSLFNGKRLYSPLFNVPATNGTMHVIEGASPFAYNIYDYLAAYSDVFGKVYGALNDKDKREFSESASIPGALNENGEMVYVDSVYVTTNELFTESRAQITNEDSMYIAVVPSDAAWDEAIAKISNLYNYGKTYNYSYKNETTKFATSITINADSLKNENTKKGMITSMYFSPSIFSEPFERTDVAGIINYAYYADSLISTNGTTYYNYAEGEHAKNPLFGNVEPVIASNGIIFPLTSYDYDPTYSLMKRSELDISQTWNVGDAQGCATGRQGTRVQLVEGSNENPEVDLTGLDRDNKSYRYFEADGNLDIYIPIPNLYSGKYRIKIQMVPNRANINTRWIDKASTDEEVIEVMQNSRFQSTLLDDAGKTIGKAAPDIYVDDSCVKTYTIWESIEIPKCYVNLPEGVTNSYPILKLSYPSRNQRKDAPDNVDNPKFGLSIAKVIIEPVHE